MEYLKHFIDIFLHIDKHLDVIVTDYGVWTYAILFLIVFCETGLVVTPFLPGDSLLFATGAIAARGGLDVHLAALLIFIAAVIGDALNYYIGSKFGAKAFQDGDPGFLRKYFLKKQHLERTERFYEKYGGKAIIIARFVPIVRTFAPFLAGIGTMSYPRFALYNVVGAALWVGLFVYAGNFFGELPIVKNNFTLVIMAIIVISILPMVIEFLRARAEAKAQASRA